MSCKIKTVSYIFNYSNEKNRNLKICNFSWGKYKTFLTSFISCGPDHVYQGKIFTSSLSTLLSNSVDVQIIEEKILYLMENHQYFLPNLKKKFISYSNGFLINLIKENAIQNKSNSPIIDWHSGYFLLSVNSICREDRRTPRWSGEGISRSLWPSWWLQDTSIYREGRKVRRCGGRGCHDRIYAALAPQGSKSSSPKKLSLSLNKWMNDLINIMHGSISYHHHLHYFWNVIFLKR